MYPSSSVMNGDLCMMDKECYSKSCIEGWCWAVNENEGATCKSTADCAQSQYCDKSSCTKIKNEEDFCTRDEMCGFGSKCVKLNEDF